MFKSDKPKEVEKSRDAYDRSFNLEDFIAKASRSATRSTAPARRTVGSTEGAEQIKNPARPTPGRGHTDDLRRVIDELKSFDAGTIRQRPDPGAKILRDRINNTLAEIFGRKTKEYQNYAIWSLDTLPTTIGGAWHPLSEIQEGYRKGVTEAIAMLSSVLDNLEEDLRRQEEEKTVRDKLEEGSPGQGEEEVQDPRTNCAGLRRAIDELRSFDVSTIKQRPDPRATILTDSINSTLGDIFGRNTREYHNHAIWSLDTALPTTISGAWQSLSEVREGYRKGIADAVAMLSSVLERLEKDLPNPPPALPVEKASPVTMRGRSGDRSSSNSHNRDEQTTKDGFAPKPSRPDSGPTAQPGVVENLKPTEEEAADPGVILPEMPDRTPRHGRVGKPQEARYDAESAGQKETQAGETYVEPADGAATADIMGENAGLLVQEEPDHEEVGGSSGPTGERRTTLEELEEKLEQFGLKEPGSRGLDPDIILLEEDRIDYGALVLDGDDDVPGPVNRDEDIGALVINEDDSMTEKPFSAWSGDTLSPGIPEEDRIDNGALVLDGDDGLSLEAADESAAGPDLLQELEKRLLELGALESAPDIPDGEDKIPTTIILDESVEEVSTTCAETPAALYALPEYDEHPTESPDEQPGPFMFQNLREKLRDIEAIAFQKILVEWPSLMRNDPVDAASTSKVAPEIDIVGNNALPWVELRALAWNRVPQIPAALETGSRVLPSVPFCSTCVLVALPEGADNLTGLIEDDKDPDKAQLLFQVDSHEEGSLEIIRLLSWTAGEPEVGTIDNKARASMVRPALAWNPAPQIPTTFEATIVLDESVEEVTATFPEAPAVHDEHVIEIPVEQPRATPPKTLWKKLRDLVRRPFQEIPVEEPSSTNDDPIDAACSRQAGPEVDIVGNNALRWVELRALAWNRVPQIPAALETGNGVLPSVPFCSTYVLVALPEGADNLTGMIEDGKDPNKAPLLFQVDSHEEGSLEIIRLLSWTAGPAASSGREPEQNAPALGGNRQLAAAADNMSGQVAGTDLFQISSETRAPLEQGPENGRPDAVTVPYMSNKPSVPDTEEPRNEEVPEVPASCKSAESTPQEAHADTDQGFREKAGRSPEETLKKSRESVGRKTPEARHNPFAAPVSKKGKGQPKAPRADVLDAHIAELQCRIDDLKSFDIDKVEGRFDPGAKALGDAVNKTLATIYGPDTYAYWQHAITSLDKALVLVGGPKPSPEEVRRAFRRGINDAVAKLTATLGSLNEKRRNLPAQEPEDIESDTPPDPPGDTRIVSFTRREEHSGEPVARKTPGADHNPFAAPVSSGSKGQPKAPRADVLDAHIAELQCRIDDLKSFDIDKVEGRFDPGAKALGDAVNKTLATIYGPDTYAYWQHAITSLDKALVLVGGPKPSPEEVRRAFRRGINDAVAKLTATLGSLNEKRRNLPAQAVC